MLIDVLALASVIGLILVWVVYPAVVSVLAAIRRRPAQSDAEQPMVSVVIATREPEEAILERVDNCLRTRYPGDRLEVVVAYARDGVPPQFSKLRESGAPVRSVRADEGGGKAVALNAGVRAANGEVIVFADTYQRFDEATIPRLVDTVMQEGIGAASGSLQLAPGTGSIVAAYWRFERWLRGVEAGLHSAVGATGAVWAMRRSLWQPLPAGLILDDVHTPMRVVLAGQRVAFVEEAKAWEMRVPTPSQEYGRKVRTLTGVVQLCAWLPAVLVPVRNPIWLQFLFHKLLRMLTPYMVTIIALWLLVVGAAAVRPSTLLGVAAVAGVGLLWLLLTRHPLAARIRHLAAEGLLIQFAVLIAGVNGMRGHWRVWDA